MDWNWGWLHLHVCARGRLVLCVRLAATTRGLDLSYLEEPLSTACFELLDLFANPVVDTESDGPLGCLDPTIDGKEYRVSSKAMAEIGK